MAFPLGAVLLVCAAIPAAAATVRVEVELAAPAPVPGIQAGVNVVPLQLSNSALVPGLSLSAPSLTPTASPSLIAAVPSALVPLKPAASKAIVPVKGAASVKAAVPVKPGKAAAPKALIETLAAPSLDTSKMGTGESSVAAEKDFNSRAQLDAPAALADGVLSAPSAETSGDGKRWFSPLKPFKKLVAAKKSAPSSGRTDADGSRMKAALAELGASPSGAPLELSFVPSPKSLEALAELPYEVFLYRRRSDGAWLAARGGRHEVSGEWGDYDIAIHNHPETRLGAYSVHSEYPSPMDLETSAGKNARFAVVTKSGVVEWRSNVPAGISRKLESTRAGRFVMRITFPSFYPWLLARSGVSAELLPWRRVTQEWLERAPVRGDARPLADLSKALISEPKLAAAVAAAVTDLPEPPKDAAELSAVLEDAIAPSLRARASELGFATPEAYAGWALSEDGAAERRELGKRLDLLPMHSGEMFSGFFRDRKFWAGATRRSLDRMIAAKAKAGERTLVLKSLGMGSGQEPYSLAILVEAALRQAKENPADWKVVIESYDINARSLWAVTQGVFSRDAVLGAHGHYGGGVPEGYEALAAELFPESGGADRLQALPRLRSWMKPVWLNLNDHAQQTAFEETPGDVAFANNTMIHMTHDGSIALSDRLLTGSWANGKYASLVNFNGMIVADILPPGAKAPQATLESADPVNVLAGANANGNIYKSVLALGEKMTTGLGKPPSAVVAFVRSLRGFLGWARGGVTLMIPAIRAGNAHARALASTPSAEKPLDAGLLDLAAGLAAAKGLRLGVHFDPVPARLDAGVLSVNAALLFADGPSVARRAAFLRRVLGGAVAALPEAPAPAVETFADASRGDAPVAAKGTIFWGATVRAVRYADGPRLVWLAGSRYRPAFGLSRSEAP